MNNLPIIIEGPAAAVTFADAKATKLFADSDGQPYVEMLLRVAQQQIDGPEGWLGRAIGLTKFRMVLPANCTFDAERVSLPPFVDVTSDIAVNGVRTIEWRSGYGATPAAPLPEPIKYAIVLMASQLAATMPIEGGEVKRETVDGIGSTDFTVSDQAADQMGDAAQRLLQPFKVWRV